MIVPLLAGLLAGPRSRETVEEEASSRPCRGDLGARVGRAVCHPDQPHRLELEEPPAGGGRISAPELPRPKPSRHPPAFRQWGRTAWSAPWPAAGAQFCVSVWWERVDSATLGPQRVQEGSVSRGRGTEHFSKGAVAPGPVKTCAVGLGRSVRCLWMKVLCCRLLAMGISLAGTGEPAPTAAPVLQVPFRHHLALLPQSLPLFVTTCASA